MKLESVYIKNFRSINEISLLTCGGFNVLIGKNNAGKSNILSAINAFFSCIEDGNAINLKPPIGKSIDLFEKDENLHIEISLTFSLSLKEMRALIDDIVTEAPQMKNAVEGIDPSLWLCASIHVTPPPNSFSFISKLSLINEAKEKPTLDPERIILNISREAAKELHEQLSKYSQQSQGAEALPKMLESIDRYYGRNISEYKTESKHIPFNYIARELIQTQINNDLLIKVEDLFDRAKSFDDFSESVKALIASMQEEATKIKGERIMNKIGTFTGDETMVPKYIKNLLFRISEMKVLYLTERRKQIGKDEAEKLLSLKVKRGGTEVLRSIQETVLALLGVQVDAFDSSPGIRRGESIAELDVDNFLVQVNGSGIREALRLILDVEFQHPQILLVEEPEIHLHPALETGMMRYLKHISSSCQIFITTHSTNFLDTAEMKNVYLVSKSDSTKVQLLNIDEAETQIPRELGIRLSSLFMFDCLVFVEGASDEDIIREWASIIGVNLSQSNVGFINMGGVRNFAHFAAEKTLSFLAKRRVKIWFIIDRDEKNNSDIVKLQEILQDRAKIIVLKKREIENYLLNPRLIMEFIKLKKAFSSVKEISDLSETDIKNAIDECAEQLKQFAINKRVVKLSCKPIYPAVNGLFTETIDEDIVNKININLQEMIDNLEELKNKIVERVKEQTEVVNTSWASDKLNIIPGDILLDMVCKKYGIRFKKERDGARLASLMRISEIDDEIKHFIKEIGEERVS